jgi:hypothetical protein
MPLLEQTQNALTEYSGNRQRGFGVHLGRQPKTNRPGINLGEIPFDGSKHSFGDINPFSIAEIATGIPHVQQTLPREAMTIAIIEDRSVGRDDPVINLQKHRFGHKLAESITDSKPGMTDTVAHYLIDYRSSDAMSKLGYDTDPIYADQDLEAIAETIANICLHSLTFIISDFKRLRLDLQSKYKFEHNAIAIKANHPAERSLPTGNAYLYVGEKAGDLPLKNKKKVDQRNESSQSRHNAIVSKLGNTGLTVAEVIFIPKASYGFNLNEVDYSLASAVSSLNS